MVVPTQKHSDGRDRITFDEDGTLDEVCSTRGAHLENMGGGHWFLIFQHKDGTETAIWFDSKNLRKPFWEERVPRQKQGPKRKRS